MLWDKTTEKTMNPAYKQAIVISYFSYKNVQNPLKLEIRFKYKV